MGEAEAKRFFPVFVDLEGRLAVVIGGGGAAEKRARQLLRYGADVTVVTPIPSETLLAGEADGALSVEQRSYVRGDLAGAFVAVCVEPDAEVRRAVYAEAESIGCLVNVSEDPGLSNFLLPSVTRRGRLEIAISTGGGAPEVAKALRKELDTIVGDAWGAWVSLVAETRGLALERFAEDPAAVDAVMTHVAQTVVRERLSTGEALSAEMMVAEAMPESAPSTALEAE